MVLGGALTAGLHIATVVCDFNWPTIQVLSMAFNGVNIVQYLKQAWDIVNGKALSDDITGLTVIGLGRSHIFKEFSSWPEVKVDNRKLKRVWLVAFGRLVQARTMTECDDALRLFFTVTLAPGADDVQEALVELQTSLPELQQDKWDSDNPPSACSQHVRHKTIQQSSPFWHHAHDLWNYYCEEFKENDSFTVNAFQNAPLAKRLVHAMTPCLPLFTSILDNPARYNLGCRTYKAESDDYRFTEGGTARWMGIVKNDILEGKTTTLVTAVGKLFESQKGRHRLHLAASDAIWYDTAAEKVREEKVEETSTANQSVEVFRPPTQPVDLDCDADELGMVTFCRSVCAPMYSILYFAFSLHQWLLTKGSVSGNPLNKWLSIRNASRQSWVPTSHLFQDICSTACHRIWSYYAMEASCARWLLKVTLISWMSVSKTHVPLTMFSPLWLRNTNGMAFSRTTSTLQLPATLLNSISSIANGDSQRSASLQRFHLLRAARNEQHFSYRATQKQLFVNLFDSERDVCATYFSPLLQYSSTVTCLDLACSAEPRTIVSCVVDVPYDTVSKEVADSFSH